MIIRVVARLGIGILAIAVMETWQAPAALAQVCYEDDAGRIVTRRRPGYREVPCPGTAETPARDDGRVVPPGAAPDARRRAEIATGSPAAPERPARTRNAVSPVPRPGVGDYVASVPLPDRWRIVDALGYEERWWDPYNRNVLKADRPVHGDWFFNLSLISDSVYENRQVATRWAAARPSILHRTTFSAVPTSTYSSKTWPRSSSITKAIPSSSHRIWNSG
jgi:hypothetical protein